MPRRLRAVWRHLAFANPPPASVVVFDREGADFLARAVLPDIPHAVMLVRGERWFLGWRVCIGMLAGLRHFDLRWIMRDPRGPWRALPGEFFKAYLYGYLTALRPRVVLTYIDTSWHFMWLSRHWAGAAFMAIQNGVRSAWNLIDDALPAPHFAQVANMPTLFCFGDYERDLYQRLNQRVDQFLPVGSLRADWYLAHVAPGRSGPSYDVCLVSQWLGGMLEGGTAFPDIQRSLRVLDDYLVRYIDERHVTCCVALRSDDPRERLYFLHCYGDRVAIPARDTTAMSSYAAIDASEVSISMDSSLMREAYGWGKKVLFCNYSGRAVNRSSPVVDLCYLDDGGYERFRERLDALLGMDAGRYRAAVVENARYLMCCERDRPSFAVVRDAVAAAAGIR